jgi:hypothetical protein
MLFDFKHSMAGWYMVVVLIGAVSPYYGTSPRADVLPNKLMTPNIGREQSTNMSLQASLSATFTDAKINESANVVLHLENLSRLEVTLTRAVDIRLIGTGTDDAERERNTYVATIFIPTTLASHQGADRLRLRGGQSIDVTVDLMQLKWVKRQDSILDYRDLFEKIPMGNYHLAATLCASNNMASSDEDLLDVNSNSLAVSIVTQRGQFALEAVGTKRAG